MKGKTLISDFTQGNIAKQLFTFATPLFLSSLLQVVYNMVDMVVVGHVLGKTGLSAVSVGGDVSGFLTFIAMGFSNAGQVIIAQYIGAGKKERLGRFIATMFSFLTIVAATLSVICFVFRRQILTLMNTPEEAFNEALGYSTVCIVGMVFIYGYNMVSAVLRGMGDSKHPFVFISIAAVLNIILDIVFVKFWSMGSSGAALATVISQAVSFVSCCVFLYKRKDDFGFDFKLKYFADWDGKMLSELVKLGVALSRSYRRGGFLKKKTARRMMTPVLDNYGLCIYRGVNCPELAFHGGWNEGFLTEWNFSLKEDLCVASMINRASDAIDEAHAEAAFELYQNAKE